MSIPTELPVCAEAKGQVQPNSDISVVKKGFLIDVNLTTISCPKREVCALLLDVCVIYCTWRQIFMTNGRGGRRFFNTFCQLTHNH